MRDRRSILLIRFGFVLLLISVFLLIWFFAVRTNSRVAFDDFVDTYSEHISSYDCELIFREIYKYNAMISSEPAMSDRGHKFVEDFLHISEYLTDDLFGYVEVPSVGIRVPLYLVERPFADKSMGAFVYDCCSYPSDGKGVHSLIYAHNGVVSSGLFSDLKDAEFDDVFYVHVLDFTLEYHIDYVGVIDAFDLSRLDIDLNDNYCTLMTCAEGFGGDKRLIARGHLVHDS